jgi:hypothetical protein
MVFHDGVNGSNPGDWFLRNAFAPPPIIPPPTPGTNPLPPTPPPRVLPPEGPSFPRRVGFNQLALVGGERGLRLFQLLLGVIQIDLPADFEVDRARRQTRRGQRHRVANVAPETSTAHSPILGNESRRDTPQAPRLRRARQS